LAEAGLPWMLHLAGRERISNIFRKCSRVVTIFLRDLGMGKEAEIKHLL
jgi:hypothetical protein